MRPERRAAPERSRFVAASGTAIVAGLLLQLAAPPVGAMGLLPIGLLLLALASDGRPPGVSFALGGLSGLVWFAGLLPALATWPVSLPFAVYLGLSLALGVILALAALLGQHLPRPWTFVALPVAWTAVNGALEAVHGFPLALASFAVDSLPLLGAPVRWVSALGFDFLLLLGAAWLGRVVGDPRERRRAAQSLIALVALWGLACWTAAHPNADVPRMVQLYGLQPAIETNTFRALKHSLLVRHEVERRLDEATAQALAAQPPGIVIWPEGGNLLANRRLARRRGAVSKLMRGSASELLIAGTEIFADGKTRNAVSRVTAEGFAEEAFKAFPVPIAESNLTPGTPEVLPTRYARVGIAVCFDGVFLDHVGALAAAGAELIVVVSDDASFGTTPLVFWHRAAARLRALEAGLPLAFVSNAGPSAAYDARSAPLPGALDLGAHGALATAVPVASQPFRSFARESHWAWMLVSWAVAGSVLAARAIRVAALPAKSWGIAPLRAIRHIPWRATLRASAFVLPTVAVASALGVSATVLSMAHGTRRSWRSIHRSYLEALSAPQPANEIASLFRQAQPKTCGAAALAYALTHLGDEVFEADLVKQMGSPDAGYSFAELAQAAQHRGFTADGMRGNGAWLRSLGGAVGIAHLTPPSNAALNAYQHFVVVLKADRDAVLFFDPAMGQLVRLPGEEFERVWSGRMLRVTPGRADAYKGPSEND